MIPQGTTTETDRIIATPRIVEILNPPAVISRSTSSWASTYASPIIQELRTLLVLENYNGVDRQAAPRAYENAVELIERAGLRSTIPMPELTPDGDGGIEIEWERNGRRLVLSCKAHPDDVDFISWREPQGQYDGQPASPDLLSTRLAWILA